MTPQRGHNQQVENHCPRTTPDNTQKWLPSKNCYNNPRQSGIQCPSPGPKTTHHLRHNPGKQESAGRPDIPYWAQKISTHQQISTPHILALLPPLR